MGEVQKVYGVPIEWDAEEDLRGDSLIRVIESPRRLFVDSSIYHRWSGREGHDWLTAGRLASGSYCLRFDDTEFEISPDGNRVRYFTIPGKPPASAWHYFVFTVLPFLLNRRGTEVLHASSVLVGNTAIAFIGDGGQGKSTFAAAMVRAGDRLVSDDAVVLLLRPDGLFTPAGPPEINLHPFARKFLRDEAAVTKSKARLTPGEHAPGTHRLDRLYFLSRAEANTTAYTKPLSGSELVVALVRAAHRLDIEDSDMLAGQLNTLNRVRDLVEARRLVYPANLEDPQAFADIVFDDLNATAPVTRSLRKRRDD